MLLLSSPATLPEVLAKLAPAVRANPILLATPSRTGNERVTRRDPARMLRSVDTELGDGRATLSIPAGLGLAEVLGRLGGVATLHGETERAELPGIFAEHVDDGRVRNPVAGPDLFHISLFPAPPPLPGVASAGPAVLLSFNHAVSDQRSVMSHLAHALSDLPPRAYPPTPAIPPTLEQLLLPDGDEPYTLRGGLERLLPPANPCFPATLSYLFSKATESIGKNVVLPPLPPLPPGAPPAPRRTLARFLRFSPASTSALVAACRGGGTSLTPVLAAALARLYEAGGTAKIVTSLDM
ncbi:hypothetical protein TeGR_g3588 [Tetraparma gracilis]|uniref:Uncharacterized protein n=1 Tax=Tetraparma gracilis TaxID=2962635 RepID=A0ABQ6M6J9_9STRA|nr:hypothetical protein TeGR_g3588 [Tetraparma gracilis]